MRKYDFDKNDNNIKCNISKEPAETEQLVEPNKSTIGATEEELQMIMWSQNDENGRNTEIKGSNHDLKKNKKEAMMNINNNHNRKYND